MLRHFIVGGAGGSNLRQVGYAEHLSVGSTHIVHDVCHLLCHPTAHASVNLVEDDCGQTDSLAYHRLQREHDTRYLTARCHLRHGLHVGAGVGTEEEHHLVGTRGGEVGSRHIHLEAHVWYAKRNEQFRQFLLDERSRLASHIGEHGCFLHAYSVQTCHLLLLLLQLLVGVVDVRELRIDSIEAVEQLVDGLHVELLLKRVDEVEAFGDEVEALRVVLHVVHLRGYLLRDILQLYEAAVETLCKLLRFRVDIGHATQLCDDGAREVHDARVVARESVVGIVKRTLYVFGVAHQLRLLLQLSLLAQSELCLAKFLLLKAQEVLVVAARSYLLAQLGKAVLRRTQLGKRRTIVGKLLTIARNDVHNVQLKVFLAEQQVLMLAVHVDELLAELAHKGECHRRIVDEGATLAISVHLATQQTLLRLVVEVVLFEEAFQHVGVVDTKVKRCLNDALVATTLHLLRIGAVAKQQSYGTDNDTLSGTGFARNDGEARVEHHLKMVDKCEVAYIEFL